MITINSLEKHELNESITNNCSLLTYPLSSSAIYSVSAKVRELPWVILNLRTQSFASVSRKEIKYVNVHFSFKNFY